jgi:peroxiredoxin Q/BCP
MPGKSVKDFSLPSTGERTFRLGALRGKKLVLYFYPKDNTPGCTAESQQFGDLHAQFLKAGCEVFGVSRDSLKSHESFKARLKLPFELLSDAEEKACAQFGVIKMKNLYGRKVRGIERSTFVVGPDGALAREWRGVKVPNHAQEVLDFVKAL